MPDNINPETNQPPEIIRMPDDSHGVEEAYTGGVPGDPGEKPEEHVPPVEIPAHPDTPEQSPVKSRQ